MTLKKQHVLALALLGCTIAIPNVIFADTDAEQNNPPQSTEATEQTKIRNAQVFNELNFNDTEEYELAGKGLIASEPKGKTITNSKGEIIWDFSGFDFEGTKPLTSANSYSTYSANPSLWRQAQLNNNQGLFKVTTGRSDRESNIYQIRGFDLANMTIIEADAGIIVLDALTAKETAKAAIEFYNANRGRQYYKIQDSSQNVPVVAVIYSHSHIDHFGGAGGIVNTRDVQNETLFEGKKNEDKGTKTLKYVKGKTYVIAPTGFLDAAVSENVYVGNAMARRAQYMYGAPLLGGKRDFRGGGVQGQIDAGLGKSVSAGTATIIAPSLIIDQDISYKLNGVTMSFQLTPNTEAPSEMTVYFNDFKALDMGEIACPLMHNLLTMRGSQVRDALQWANYLTQSMDRYGSEVEVMLGQHNWPRWGTAAINDVLASQRDSYKYIHDQSLRLTNEGYTMNELAEMVVMPDSLKKRWFNQGYYGSLKHNVKAIYQKYIGWYDANPAHLNPLTDKAASEKYIDYMGGLDSVIEKAKKDFAEGNYRWVAQVMNNAVFAFPESEPARKLQADALEQLGYQAEASTWRNAYLMGANELRNGIADSEAQEQTYNVATDSNSGLTTFTAMTVPMLFDYTAIRLNGPKANGKRITIIWKIECEEKLKRLKNEHVDANEISRYEEDMCGDYAMTVENSTLTYFPKNDYPNLYDKALTNQGAITLKMTRPEFDALMLAQIGISGKENAGTSKFDSIVQELINSKKVFPNEKSATLLAFFQLLDTFPANFPIVWPQGLKTNISDRN